MTKAQPVEVVIARVQAVYRCWTRETTVAAMRADWDALFAGDSQHIAMRGVNADGVPAAWIEAAAPAPSPARGQNPKPVVLYLHGGGFVVGSIRSHAELMHGIATAASCRVLGIDYRLAPEHRYPLALEDAACAYRWLLAQGVAPSHIAMAGDSAGAGLALALLLTLREQGLPAPCAAVLLSPLVDLTASGDSYQSRAALDPIHQRPMILAMAQRYLGPATDAREPLASPLFADLRGLPPLLIQVGERETIVSDASELARRVRAAGGVADLSVWPGMIHVFQQFPAELESARAARAAIGSFLGQQFQQSIDSTIDPQGAPSWKA